MNCPFLMFTGLAGPCGRDQQIGLTAQKRRNLQDVDHLGGDRRVRRLVDVGEHRQARCAP